MLPDDHHEFRAVAHGQLANIHSEVGDVPRALAVMTLFVSLIEQAERFLPQPLLDVRAGGHTALR
jgi:hypothetical protein